MKNKINYYLIILLILFVLVLPNFASAITAEEIQTQINALLAQINQLQSQLSQIQKQNPAGWCHTFNINLMLGGTGQDASEITYLQTALQKQGVYTVTVNGNFDEYTFSAVKRFQEKYVVEVLFPWGLTKGTGFVGPTTRSKLNQLYGCTQTLTLLPATKKYITLLSPNGGEIWNVGNLYTIRWSSLGFSQSDNLGIKWQKVNNDGTSQMGQIVSGVPAAQETYNWQIPGYQTLDSKYRIIVYDSYGNIPEDSSDNYFSIVNTAIKAGVVVPVALPANRYVNSSSGWVEKSNGEMFINSNGWLDYDVDFGSTGESYYVGLTAANIGVPPRDYQFNIDVYVDDSKKGSFKFKAHQNEYPAQSLLLGLITGKHRVRFYWTNDYSSGGYDANIQIKEVFFRKINIAPTTIQADEYFAKSQKWQNKAENELLQSNGGWQWLEYMLFIPDNSSYGFGLTAKNAGIVPPNNYQFNIQVYVDDQLKGSFQIPASQTQYNTNYLVLNNLWGYHRIRFIWTNDAFVKNQYDANILIRETFIKRY